MRLKKAATRFDKTKAEDAYNSAVGFMCQLAPLDLYKIDGTAVKRRQMSTGTDITMPPRSVIRIDGQPYLVGSDSPDFWRGERIRNNYVLQGADHTANLYSIAQALANTAPATAYASLDFNKNMTDERDSSEYHSQYNIFFGGGEPVLEGGLINIGSRWFYVKNAYISVSGLLVTLTSELDPPLFETINYGSRTYVPATDTYTATTTSVKVMRVRWQEHFSRLSKSTEKHENGDAQLFVLKSAMATAKPSDTLALSDGTWRVLAVQDEGTVLSLHVRRA
jgi:hypothetical protein